MKRITFAAILTVAVLSLAILAGCGAKSGSAGAPAGVEQPSAAEQPSAPEQPSAAEQPSAPEQPSAAEQSSAAEQPSAPEQPSAAEDGSISVRSVLELTEAIRPGAKLVIEPGRYNLTDFLGAFSDEQACSAWNESHQYVQIIPVYDGVELEIRDVSGLSIRGGSERTSGTELVVEPRNAAVLHFLDCSDISLEGITMGHTETGACNGNVLDFMGCSRVSLRAMDLYGCGVYGVCVSEGSTWLSVSDSVIRDCSAGPFMIVDAPEGEFRFTDCSFTGSAEGGYYGFWGTSSLTFLRCAFGKEETDRWRWDDTAVFEDCIWTESPAEG
ncbi:MAG: hypothetical protein IJU66_06530 [Oscillospiraceae bacterium]|nr:hypothetical protein [Oscillospiraceae bacterium]